MNIQHTQTLLPVLKAWAEGRRIQYRGEQTMKAWVDVDPDEANADPQFHLHGLEWRVKPTPLRIKVVLTKSDRIIKRVYSDDYPLNVVDPETEQVVTFEQVTDDKEGI